MSVSSVYSTRPLRFKFEVQHSGHVQMPLNTLDQVRSASKATSTGRRGRYAPCRRLSLPLLGAYRRVVSTDGKTHIILAMSTKLKIPDEFDAVSSEERIAYVQALWDRIARTPEQLPIPEEHKRILDERLDAYEGNPKAGRPWDEIREELLKQLRGA